MQIMLDAGIATRRGIMCSHREAVYSKGPQRVPLPHSEAAQDHCVILPLYPQMTAAEQQQVATALKKACALQ
jgi:perosamine synthetase